jgi:hypothetical protein
MLVTLVAILCNGPLCLEKVVTNSEQSGITMTACQVNAQSGIAEWLANGPYHEWKLEGYKCVLGKYTPKRDAWCSTSIAESKKVMRFVLTVVLSFALCASANAATSHRFAPPRTRLLAHERVPARMDQRVSPSQRFAVPGWTNGQTEHWLDSATAAAGLD